MRLRRWRWFCQLVIALWFVSTLGFMASTYPSGPALSGKIENGHYFVHGKLNGKPKYTEVQPSTYYLKRTFALLNFAMAPAYIAAFFLKCRIEARITQINTEE